MFNPFKKPVEEETPKRLYVRLLTSVGEFEIDFFADEAPSTVKNFIRLAKAGFYDGLKFHRVLAGVLVQTGCPKGDGTGNPGYHIKCELGGPKQQHEPGVLSMAHTGRDMGGSQFFICLSRQVQFDGNHTCFGKITKGLEHLDQVALGDTILSAEVRLEAIQAASAVEGQN